MEETYPQLIDRIQSTFIDMILFLTLMFIATSISDKFEDAPDWTVGLFVGLLFLYEPLCTTLGCTLGNYFKGIRVRRASDTTKRINFVQAISRYMFKLSLGWVSFLTIHSNAKRRAIHDMISGSVMIKL